MGALDGKVATITGAAGGIGSAAARRFIAEGARVQLVDREEGALARLAAEFPADRVAWFAGDLTDEATVKASVDAAVSRFGRVDIALLNAGIEGQIGRIEDVSVGVFDQVMAVNVRSVWLGLASLMPVMRSGGGGSIIVTSSVAGLRGSGKLAAYSASKHAVVGLAKSAALEGAPDLVRVNTINPAATQTRMIDSIDEAMRAGGRVGNSAQRVPLARYADPSEVVAMMLFLASDESRFCTGGSYLVDGGAMA